MSQISNKCIKLSNTLNKLKITCITPVANLKKQDEIIVLLNISNS